MLINKCNKDFRGIGFNPYVLHFRGADQGVWIEAGIGLKAVCCTGNSFKMYPAVTE
jgi:hypothetical protein